MKKEDKKLLLTLLSMLFVSVSLAFSTRFFRAFQGPKQFFLVLFTGAIIVFWGFTYLRYRWRVLRWKPLIPVYLYLIITIISTLASRNPHRGLDTVVEVLCSVLVFTVIYIIGNIETVEKMTPFILFTALVAGIYSLMQHFGLDPVSWAQAELVRSRSISTFGNPDFLSSFLVMTIPLALCRAMEEPRRNYSIAGFALTGFLCMVNIYTYSRTGLISMAIGISAFLIFAGKNTLLRHRWKLTALALAVILAFGAVATFEAMGMSHHTLSQRTEAFIDHQENNVATRIGLWRAAALIFGRNFFLGVGPGNFGITYLPLRHLEPVIVRNRVAMPSSSHNLFLDIACRSGVFALISMLVFIGFLIFSAHRYFGRAGKKNNTRYILAAGYGGTLAAYFAHHQASFPTLPSELLFWISAAFCLVLALEKRTQMLPSMDKPPAFKPFDYLAIGILGIAVLLTVFTWGQKTLGEYYAQRAEGGRQTLGSAVMRPEKRGEVFKESYYYYGRAVKLDPNNQEYWIRLGKMLESYSYSLEDQDLLRMIVTQSEQAYLTAIALEPGNPYPHADLARLLNRFGLVEQAEQNIRQAVRLDPYNPILATQAAIIYQSAGKIRRAERHFRRAIWLYPIGPDGYGNLGIFYFNHNRYDEARKMFSEALERDRDNSRYQDYMHKIDSVLQEKENHR